ncbi:MAG: DUF3857 and transglutaminase domain-containing protein [Bacteroidales bacterium]|nr:DUF3857 and transglutaminase domain-containing protein [Bacteroidales bacterium]
MIFRLRNICLLFCFLSVTANVYPAVFNCEVIRYITFVEISHEKLITTDTIIMRINNRSGDIFSAIELNYSKDSPITDLSAWIEDQNGKIIRYLKKQEITESSAISDASFYEDSYVKRFVLKHNDYPYRIGYTYKTTKRQFLHIANWYPILGFDVPTRLAQLIFISPENYPVNIREHQIKPAVITHASGITRKVWTAAYDGTFSSEVYCPDISGILPSVKIVPTDFFYGTTGSTKDWESFGNWQYSLINGLDDLPQNEKLFISKMIEGIQDEKEIVRILYHYMQDHTRYINVSMDIGGLKPYPASYVSQNKYGDCKALTNYMKALLNYAGIKSYYTLVYAGTQSRRFLEDFPSQQFNHVILTVPLEHDTIWLENTNNTSPVGYVGTFIQNRSALLIDEGKSKIIRLPSLQDYEALEGKHIDFLLQKGMNSEITMRISYRGLEFDRLNALHNQYNLEDQDHFLRKILPFPNYDLKTWKLIQKDRDSSVITFVSDLILKNILQKAGDEYYFAIFPTEIPDFTSPKLRKLPINIPYPICSSDTLVYHLPLGTNKVSIPEPADLSTRYGRYKMSSVREHNTLTVYREFCLNRGFYSLEEYPQLFDFVSAAKTYDKRKFIIQ